MDRRDAARRGHAQGRRGQRPDRPGLQRRRRPGGSTRAARRHPASAAGIACAFRRADGRRRRGARRYLRCRPMADARPHRAQRRRRRPAAAMAGDARQQSVRSAVRRRLAGRRRRRDRRSHRTGVPAVSGRRLPLHGAGARAAFPQRRDRPCSDPRGARGLPDRICEPDHSCHQRRAVGRAFTRRP